MKVLNDQHILIPGPLLDEDGNLSESGYANSLVKSYDRTAIKVRKSRIKEWDYYYVGNSSYGCALTVADNGYMSMASISVLEFGENPGDVTKSIIGAFPLGKLGLPPTTEGGDVVFENEKKGFSMKFIHQPDGKRRLICVMKKFKGEEQFRCDILLEESIDDSLVIATPFKKKRHFYYNQKINLLKAGGYCKVGEKMYDFNQGSWGVLDWGRGVWTYKNTWYWSSVNATSNGVSFGWNLGYGFGCNQNATENIVYIGDDVVKLGKVVFDIPMADNNSDDFMKEWTIRSPEGNISAKFKPIYNRHSDTNALLIRSNQNQVFGTFTGYILYEGKKFYFSDVIGFAEKVYNRW